MSVCSGRRKYRFHWSTIIFSLSGSRSSRAESLLFVHEMARCRPEVQTIILANNESEMHLIGHLMPACLHGILNKSAPRRGLQERLLQLLDNHHLSGSEQFCDREACNDPLSFRRSTPSFGICRGDIRFLILRYSSTGILKRSARISLTP